MNRNPPSETRVSNNHGQPRLSSSVALSRQQVQEEQNQINRQAQEEEARIDEEEQNLEEQEAVDSANNAILATKARSRGARVRQELEDRRFEVAVARSESLAQVEDEKINDIGDLPMVWTLTV
jgi:hypothetical protein